MPIIGRLIDLWTRVGNFFRSPYYGFVLGHAHLRPDDLKVIADLVGKEDKSVVSEFERRFGRLIGAGEVISYAAARMGFYELMRAQGITKDCEVILVGATCSVMINAVLRIGATPIFSDIDPCTFGSSADHVAACISPRTKMIVAQHSFGIPCDILPIVALAKEHKIFLVEDCALTLGSTINGLVVGNFGDAALFSFDHSKPINTLVGGAVYTKNLAFASRLRAEQSEIAELPNEHQAALWRRLLLEIKFCVPAKYGKLSLIDLYFAVKGKFSRVETAFLADDTGSTVRNSYPYPARLPAFLAAVGLVEVERWPAIAMERKASLSQLIDTISKGGSGAYLPSAYLTENSEIIPLRFVWQEPDGEKKRRSLRKLIDIRSTWFMRPIISTNEPLDRFGYISGMCPTSEKIGPNMINIPCIFNRQDMTELIAKLNRLVV